MNSNNTAASGASSAVALVFVLVYLAVILLMLASMWKVFSKAGQPGWACIIPFYNVYVLLQIAGKPGWWLLLYFIPLVNVVMYLITVIAVAENFGKGVGFALGMVFLPFIFYPLLAFGDASYGAAVA